MPLLDWLLDRVRPRPKPTPPPQPPARPPGDFAAALLNAHNFQRTSRGLPALSIDPRVAAAAQAHAADMAGRDRLDHTGADGSNFMARMRRAGWTGPSGGENIAAGQQTPQAAVAAWMNSTGHRANILNAANWVVGFGFARAADGTPYWCADFGG